MATITGIYIAILFAFVGVVIVLYPRFSQREILDLMILVSSARENFEQRTAVRESWGGNIPSTLNDRVKVLFVIGDKYCDVPIEDRVDMYSCIPWLSDTAELQSDIQEALVSLTDTGQLLRDYNAEPQPFGMESATQKFPYQKLFLAFRVLHPIIIRRFGLHKSVKFIVSSARIPLFLFNSANQQEVTRVHFSGPDPGILKANYFYQPVKSFLLPKGFEGTLVLDTSDDINSFYFIKENKTQVFCLPRIGSREIHFYQDSMIAQCWSLLVVNFLYSVDDTIELKEHIEHRPERYKYWLQQKAEEKQHLVREHKSFSDILFVSHLDTYRSLPKKMLLAQVKAMNKYSYSYLLKSDDDCYLDVKQILKHLRSVKHKTFWSGKFRSNWAVERYGKWAEWDYEAVVYPKFACGSGNVITSDISEWLVKISSQLKVYQGEDVTMGVWMAALGPHTVDDQRWQCTKTCKPNMFSMPDLSVEELSKMWADKIKCDNPCGCK